MQIPTELDWQNPYGDLDIKKAKEHFFGKTLEEAEELFVENALYYQEDILFMPSIPFRYSGFTQRMVAFVMWSKRPKREKHGTVSRVLFSGCQKTT